MSTNYFLTGGAGFIGSSLIKKILEIDPDCRITVYDNYYRHLSETKLNNPRLTYIKGDLLDLNLLKQSAKNFDVVIHLAAMAGVDSVLKDSVRTMKVNIQGAFNLLDAVSEGCKNCRHFVNFSTSEIFGAYAFKVSEKDIVQGGNVAEARWSYSVSKIASEYLVRSYASKFGFAFSSIRPFNVYGPGQIGEGAIHNFVCRALKNEPILVRGEGNQIRSWCYIDDIVNPLTLIADNPKAYNEDFNIGNPQSTLTIYHLAKLIKELLNSRSEIIFEKGSYVDVALRVPNVEKMINLLNYKPTVSLDEGILKTAEWYRAHF